MITQDQCPLDTNTTPPSIPTSSGASKRPNKNGKKGGDDYHNNGNPKRRCGSIYHPNRLTYATHVHYGVNLEVLLDF